MKRVAIITNIPAPYRVDLFYYLQQHTAEYEIHIIYASRNEDNRNWKVDAEKMMNSHFLDSWTIKIPRKYDTRYIHVTHGIKKMLEQLKPDLVVGSEYNPTILQAVSDCRKWKIPYVSWTDGTLHSERNISILQRKFRKYVIQNADAYLASSTRAKEAQIHYGAEEAKCFISFLTVDLNKYFVEQSVKHQRNRMICVGSLIERKGMDLLLKALKEVKEEYKLVIAGEGAEKAELEKLAVELGVRDKVEFLGYLSQEELKIEYAKSGIFVLPTREDCFALVILEAMCAGLPVISSIYADGAYDMIREGETGYFVDPYQQREFSVCIENMLKHPDITEKMGKNARDYLDKFSFEEVSKGFWQVFACALKKKQERK